jgi:hypothetical protein
MKNEIKYRAMANIEAILKEMEDEQGENRDWTWYRKLNATHELLANMPAVKECKEKNCQGYFIDAETETLTRCDACDHFTSDKQAQEHIVLMDKDEFGFQIVYMHPDADSLDELANFKNETDAIAYVNKLKGA